MDVNFNFKAVDSLYESNYFGLQILEAPEFYWKSLFGALLTYHDEESRPIGEEIAPTKVHNNAPMEFQYCKYSGTRLNHPLPMNVSSLKQFMNHWKEVVTGISSIREAYLKQRDKPLTDPVSIIDLWIISRICQIWPAYLLRRKSDPFENGKIPVVPSIIHRISLGLHRIAHVHLIKRLALGKELDVPSISATELYLLAEKLGLLVGSYSVCAGPRSMIEQSYQAMLRIDDAPSSTITNLVNDDFLTYSYRHMCLEVEKGIFGVYSAFILYDLIEFLSPFKASPLIKKLYEDLVNFEVVSATNGPLVHEIGREDLQMLTGNDLEEITKISDESRGQLRKRMLIGLERLRFELDKLYKMYKPNADALVTELMEKQKSIAVCKEAKIKLYSFFNNIGYESGVFKSIADFLLEYLALESISMAIFEILQDEVSQSIGHVSEIMILNASDDLQKVFGPRLRDFMSSFFQIQITNTSRMTSIKCNNDEFSSCLWQTHQFT